MKESALRESIKEDLFVLGIYSYQNIAGFRRIFGKDKDALTVTEIVDGLRSADLPALRDLINRSLDKWKIAPVAKQS